MDIWYSHINMYCINSVAVIRLDYKGITMFNIKDEVKRLEQLEVDKIQGLPYKPKPVNPKVIHIKHTTHYELEAECEGIAISKRPKFRNPDFDIRIRKARGENHRRRGHFSCSKTTII